MLSYRPFVSPIEDGFKGGFRLVGSPGTEVAVRLRVMRKPRSMVPGDIFPQLVANYAVPLSFPLADIYNAVTKELHWPLVWKREFVTVIPKGLNPESLGQCRNISCTNLFSNVLESFMLQWSWGQIKENMRQNQYLWRDSE